jgi:multiple sugar transport system ATP-binding protein
VGRIVLEGITKVFGDTVAVRDVSLTIDAGQFVALVGPSGCGKTTLLRIVAGLEKSTEGSVYVDDRRVDNVPSKDRDLAMVFQDYALYPHMTVRQNLEYGLKLRKVRKDERERRVREIAQMLGIMALLDRRPGAISGGQRQRVALGRAIIRQPKAFLMDEPLSNLDAKLRAQMRAELRSLHDSLCATTIYVTHDQIEAMTMADQIVALRGGEVQQIASPDEIYGRPANVFVAAFIGSPSMNFLDGTIEQNGAGLRLRVGPDSMAVPERVAKSSALRAQTGRRVVVGVRPEHLTDTRVMHQVTDTVGLTGVVEVVENVASDKYLYVAARDAVEVYRVDDEIELEDHEAANGNSKVRALVIARAAANADVTRGDLVRLSMGFADVHLFDRDTGARVH